MRHIIFALLMAMAWPAFAQSEATVSFGGMRGDPSLPVTVTAQMLTVDQGQASAVFLGEVLVVQGQMRLSADELRVVYAEEAGRISQMWAKGNVVLVNDQDAVRADTAEYVIDEGMVYMQGNVVLTQGEATFTAARFSTDLTRNLGKLEGGVAVVFTPQGPSQAKP